MKGIKLREGILFPILIAFLLFSMVAVISVGSASIDMGTVYRIHEPGDGIPCTEKPDRKGGDPDA